MKRAASFVSGYLDKDTKRINHLLKKLLNYFPADDFAIVGGLAIRYHLLNHGLVYPVRPFNDLDIIIATIDNIPSSVSKDFLIAEYHPPKESGYFIVKLVDPESKTKVDIFPFYPSSPDNFIKVPFFGKKLNLVSIEEQLIKTTYDTFMASPSSPIEPKQFTDMRLLEQIADFDLTGKLWKNKRFKNRPKTFTEALKEAEIITKEHPEWIKEKSHKGIKPFECTQCKAPADFPITPMDKIFRILGYTE